MGRVKSLWEQEIEEEFQRLVKKYLEEGMSQEEAEAAAADEMDEEDQYYDPS